MIFEALNKLLTELQTYLTSVTPSLNLADSNIALNNVALLESADAGNDIKNQHVIISLVNVEEESSLKNGLHYRRTPIGGIQYENPPVYLNLYLLFTTNFANNYPNSLTVLGKIIQFFQGQNIFSMPTDEGDMQLTLDLYTMTFEQINHLWGSLGGKQIPFVMYKARLVRITDRKSQGAGSPIIEIQANTSPQL